MSFLGWLLADLLLVVVTAWGTWQFAALVYEERERRAWWEHRGGWPDYDPTKDLWAQKTNSQEASDE